MIKENNKTCVVIGAGVSGLAASVRMRNKGFKVILFEANSFPGGKLSSETEKGYRFEDYPYFLKIGSTLYEKNIIDNRMCIVFSKYGYDIERKISLRKRKIE